MAEPLTRPERDALVKRLYELHARRFPTDERLAPDEREGDRLYDLYYQLLGEYADRLPRLAFGACPFSGAPLKRAVDPYGLDGPFWWMVRPFEIEEPKAPAAFRVLLGALDLKARVPAEARDAITPGPGAPYVVPRLLAIPGMVAVLHAIDTALGDRVFAVSYWNRSEIPETQLHQEWLRRESWHADGGWQIHNDPWDFDLAPYLADGRLRWIAPDDADLTVRTRDAGACPFLGHGGSRAAQLVQDGALSGQGAPDGRTVNPFVE